jgi:hypothetical protein
MAAASALFSWSRIKAAILDARLCILSSRLDVGHAPAVLSALRVSLRPR